MQLGLIPRKSDSKAHFARVTFPSTVDDPIKIAFKMMKKQRYLQRNKNWGNGPLADSHWTNKQVLEMHFNNNEVINLGWRNRM